MTSRVPSRIWRKLAFGLVGHLIGGYAGKFVADHLEHAFHVGEGVATVLDISPDIAGKSIELGSEVIGAFSTTFALEKLEEIIWHEDTIHSETPPSSPEKGQFWFLHITQQLYVWTGGEWLVLAPS